MTKAQIAAALGALFTGGLMVNGYWLAQGDGSPATIVVQAGEQDTPSAAATAITTRANKAGAAGWPLYCGMRKSRRDGGLSFKCTNKKGALFTLSGAALTGFVAAVKSVYPNATSADTFILTSSDSVSYDKITMTSGG